MQQEAVCKFEPSDLSTTMGLKSGGPTTIWAIPRGITWRWYVIAGTEPNLQCYRVSELLPHEQEARVSWGSNFGGKAELARTNKYVHTKKTLSSLTWQGWLCNLGWVCDP